MIPQDSRFRRAWDVLILTLIFANCWLVPAQISFVHEVMSRGTMILFVIDLFFLIDMALNFFTSYRSGGVEITSNGGENEHGTLDAGESLGDLSMVLGEQRTASVKALSFCELLVLSKEDFLRIKTGYPEFKEVLKKVSAEKSDKITEMILEGVIL